MTWVAVTGGALSNETSDDAGQEGVLLQHARADVDVLAVDANPDVGGIRAAAKGEMGLLDLGEFMHFFVK